MGPRRRRLRLAEGADGAARPRDGRRLARRLGARRPFDAAELLLRLGRARGRRSSSSTARSRRPSRSCVALDVALGLLLEDGLDAAFERHARLGRACRAGIKALGLELFSPGRGPLSRRHAARMPDGIASRELTLTLRERHGITIAAGQGELKDAIFRIGHIGWYDEFDIATALSAVELVLAELGAPIERGVAAVARARGVRGRSHGLKVLVREAIAPAGVELLRSRFEVDEDQDSPLEEIIGGYDAIVIRSATKLTADVIERARAAEGDRPCGRGRRQRRRRRGDPPRDRRRQRARLDRRLRGRAHDRPARRARPQHPAGARRTQGGPLGALALGRDRARRQDARRARLRPDRPPGGAARARARHARGRLRPVRRSGALPRARRGARGGSRRGLRCRRLPDPAPAADRGDARLRRRRGARADARRRPDRQRRARRAPRRGGARRRRPLGQGGRRGARRLLGRAVRRASCSSSRTSSSRRISPPRPRRRRTAPG